MFTELKEELLDLRVTEKGYRNALYANNHRRRLFEQHRIVVQPDLLQALLELTRHRRGVRDVNPLPSLPYLAPWYRVACEPGKVVLEYGQRIVCLEGGAADRLVPALLPLLDGTRTIDEIVAALGEAARPAVERVLGELARSRPARGGAAACRRLSPCPSRGAAELLASLRPGARRRSPRRPLALDGCSVAVAGRGGGGLEVRAAAALERCLGRVVGRGSAAGVDLDALRARARTSSRSCPSGTSRRSRPRSRGSRSCPSTAATPRSGPLYLPGRHVLLRVLPASARGEPRGVPDELALLDGAPAAYPSAPAARRDRRRRSRRSSRSQLARSRRPLRPGGVLRARAAADARAHRSSRPSRAALPRACSGLADVAAPLPWHKEIPLAAGLSFGRSRRRPVAATLPRLRSFVSPLTGVVRSPAETLAAPDEHRLVSIGCELADGRPTIGDVARLVHGQRALVSRPGRGGGDRRGARALLGLVRPAGAARRRARPSELGDAVDPGAVRAVLRRPVREPRRLPVPAVPRATPSSAGSRDSRCPDGAPRVPARAARLHAVAASRVARDPHRPRDEQRPRVRGHARGGDPRRAARARRARRLHARLAQPPLAAAARLERRRGHRPARRALLRAVAACATPPSTSACSSACPTVLGVVHGPPAALGALGVGAACAPRR